MKRMRLCLRTSLRRALAVSAVLLAAGVAAGRQRLVFSEWQRASTEPVIRPTGDGWESAGTFNPAVVLRNGKYVMLYRAQDHQGTSRLGYAESTDGIHFTRRENPVLTPEASYEANGGVEDPRLVQIE